MMVATSAILGTALLGHAQTVLEPANNTTSIKVERSELQRMIQAEVQKQLPPLVEREVQRKMGELVKRIENTQVRLMREQQAAHRWETTKSILQTLRSQLELYKIMHADRFPTMEQMKNWRALTAASDSRGNFVANGNCGPYLQEPPTSPLTEKSAIAPTGAPTTADAGWLYDERTGELKVIVPATEAQNIKSLTRAQYEIAR
jgi:hypothetical protein